MSESLPEVEVTVLAVDDDVALLNTLRRSLRDEGYRILTTTDPRQVGRIIEEEKVDVLLSDVEMPGLNGLELVAQVKEEHPEVVRILITGHSTMTTAMTAINKGEVFRFLTKPWDLAELRATVREAVLRAREFKPENETLHDEDRRTQLLEALEVEHPGITTVSRIGGVYKVDRRGVENCIEKLPAPWLRALLDAGAGEKK